MDSPTFSPNKSAIRFAMVLAANRLGSNINIFFPFNQGSFIKANGSKVLLPAPGGALTIKVDVLARKASDVEIENYLSCLGLLIQYRNYPGRKVKLKM